MILFMILLLTLVTLLIVSVLAISAGGAVMIIIFGDVIVCIFILGWIIKLLINKKRRS